MTQPDPLPALLDEAIASQREGRDADALAALERCLDAFPAHGAAHAHAALSSYRLGNWDLGLAHARAAVACAPESAAAWIRMAAGLRAAGRAREAQEAAQRAIALDPRAGQAWNIVGFLAQDAGDFPAAREHHGRALSLESQSAEARMAIAQCDEGEGRLDDAIAGYRKAATLDPTDAEIPYNLARLFHLRGLRLADAIATYREAIALRPGFAFAHHNLAHALFLSGDFGPAWREYRWRPPRVRYEARLAQHGGAKELPRPDTLAGTRLRILGEQGLGDTLFFLRFAPLLRERGAVLEFAGDPRLSEMLAGTGLFDAVGTAARDESSAPEILAGDLPLLLPDADTAIVPPPLALAADPSRTEAARRRLAEFGPGPYVALAWRAGIRQGGVYETLRKEIPLDALGAALAGLRATWISVQREPDAEETRTLSHHAQATVHDLSSINEDLDDALAWMSVLDDWAGVSNTNIHLRAATGGTARVLVPFPPEWRWMAQGDSPWFPAMRTYRQGADHSWSEALERLAEDLRAKAR